MSLEEATFRNESEVDIPPELMASLTLASRGVAKQLREEGYTQESMKGSVVVLTLPPTSDASFTVVLKEELREYVDSLRVTVGSDENVMAMVRPSLIQRCMESSPNNAVRVLWLASGYNGTLQLHLDGATPAGTGSKLRLHDRTPLLEDLTPQSLVRKFGSPQRADKALEKREADIKGELTQLDQVQEVLRRLNAGEEPNEKLTDVTNELLKALKKYPPKQARDILEKVHRHNEDLMQLRDAIAHDEVDREKLEKELQVLMPTFCEKWDEVKLRARKAPTPPGGQSANNIEVLLMAAAYVFDPVYTFATVLAPERVNELVSSLIGYFATRTPEVEKLLKQMNGVLRGKPFSGNLQDFGHDWLASGFPKLEVGHKLAATLAMTDVPDDIEVMAPWKAWSLVIPPGLLGEPPGAMTYSRMWIRGTDIEFLVGNDGEIQGPLTKDIFIALMSDKRVQSEPGALPIIHAMQSLVKGACLALSNPDDYKRQSLKDKAASIKKPKRETDVPDFSVSRFMLSAPVQIDVRQHLLDYVAGKKTTGGSGPKVQFFVRGHWRNQAHGPRMSLRKQMRIEGYWKGPEHGAIKLGNYKVKDEDGDPSVPKG